MTEHPNRPSGLRMIAEVDPVLGTRIVYCRPAGRDWFDDHPQPDRADTEAFAAWVTACRQQFPWMDALLDESP